MFNKYLYFFYSERASNAPSHMRVAPNGIARSGQDSAGHQKIGDCDGNANQTQAQVSRDDQIGYDY